MAKIVAIKENHVFSKVYHKGKKDSQKNIVVYALRNFKTADTRLGITTGKKLGGAVERSRARRLIREAYRRVSDGRTWKKPWWIVVVARGSLMAKGRKMGEVQADLEKAFSRLSLFSEE